MLAVTHRPAFLEIATRVYQLDEGVALPGRAARARAGLSRAQPPVTTLVRRETQRLAPPPAAAA